MYDIERATAHLIPKHPQYHAAGITGAAYGGIAILAYWGATSVGLPSLFASLIAVAVAYLAGRYDGSVAWKRYYREFDRMLEERARNA